MLHQCFNAVNHLAPVHWCTDFSGTNSISAPIPRTKGILVHRYSKKLQKCSHFEQIRCSVVCSTRGNGTYIEHYSIYLFRCVYCTLYSVHCSNGALSTLWNWHHITSQLTYKNIAGFELEDRTALRKRFELQKKFKGSVKWKKRWVVSGISRSALYSSTFPQIFYFFLKDPGPLKSIKHIWAVKQLFMCSDRIMWPPGSEIRYREATWVGFSQYRSYTSIIEANSWYLILYIFRGF